MFERQTLVTPPTGPETPATFGTPFRAVPFASGPRTLDGVMVEADVPDAPVLVLAHGTAESVSSWADVQALWRTMGAASFVFDYSGFGRSTGVPRVEALVEDTRAAWREARRRFGPGRRYVLVGYSLGTGPALEAVRDLRPAPDALALVAGYTSARAATQAFLRVPPWMGLLLPDVFNNVRALRDLPVPALVLHSEMDDLFPVAMADSLAAADRTRIRLARLPAAAGFRHDDGHRRPDAAYWMPLVSFAAQVARGN